MKKKSKLSRRGFLKGSAALGAGSVMQVGALGLAVGSSGAEAASLGSSNGPLSDPALQPKFVELAPNALSPKFKYFHKSGHKHHKHRHRKKAKKLKIVAAQYVHKTGLVDANGNALLTPVWGYGRKKWNVTWPGKTIEVFTNQKLKIKWRNKLVSAGTPLPHILPVDTSFHWAYGIPGYTQYNINTDGVPIVPHVHGAHVNTNSDGNPEYFFSPNFKIKGPRWVHKNYVYDNTQQAGALWYHDHSLGITRLNVYAGLVGFYFIRDNQDTGKLNNPLGLPAGPYELAYAIQDKMFKSNGELFYPAYPSDPSYADFITANGVNLPAAQFPNGGPTVLTEFFGDHIVVNGKIWPKTNVEPRHYRLRLLNGCDSRFLGIRFRIVPAGATTISANDPILPFWHIGGDLGLAAQATQVNQLVVAPAERPDIVVDFSQVPAGSRVIMENIAGDAPFDGTLTTDPGFDPANLFANRQTDRIMAFDVTQPLSAIPDNFDPTLIAHFAGVTAPVDNVRKLALFEGRDELGRLQPMLGVAEPTVDMAGNTVNGSTTWHMPITENPALGSTEIWEIYNNTPDAHPIHVHLVHFEILNREKFQTNIVNKPITLHNGSTGLGAEMQGITLVPNTLRPADPTEKCPRDMVICYPGEVTRIKMTFDRPGRYVWHCHILSHEDHDMMRPLFVG